MKKRLILALLWLALPLFVCVAGGTRENSIEGTAAVENSPQTAGSAAGLGNDSIGNSSNLWWRRGFSKMERRSFNRSFFESNCLRTFCNRNTGGIS
jgi:hypothetical protein